MVTLLIVLTTILAYGLEMAVGGLSACEAHGLVPATFNQTGNLAPMASYLLLHDPESVSHLAGNMAALILFGMVVEGHLGGTALLLIYGLAGLAGGLLHVLVDPASTTPLVGASGGVFGLMAVAGVLRPRLLGFVVGFGAMEVGRAILGGGEGVSFGCHLGGLAAGAAVAMWLRVTGNEALEAT